MSDVPKQIDLTLAVTAHAETVVAGPTMRSAEVALAALENGGYSVERLIGFDRGTAACRAYMGQFENWRTVDFDFGDQGKSRNALAQKSSGRWLSFLDAVDLLSENWLLESARMLECAESAHERIIVHPELNWQFDGATVVHTNSGQDDPLFTPYYLAMQNPYDALCAGPREAWIEVPYPTRQLAEGFAFEDWQWAIETMTAGWHHVVAKDTIIFKRRREGSQSGHSKNNNACIRPVEALAIDRIAELGAPAVGDEAAEIDGIGNGMRGFGKRTNAQVK